MIKKAFLPVCMIVISFVLISWGGTGHKIISSFAFLSFKGEMSQFSDWKTFLVDHSSDADYRRNDDPNEGPKHYIDIDNYPEFLSTGKIAQDPYVIVAQHGTNFVVDNGILPWASIASYDSLESCFKRRDWIKAKVFAADLGHYVADGHMPLHITNNYDGKLTGNSGIHSFYESGMLNTYGSQITFSGDSASLIANTDSFIFNYIYSNYSYVDSVLQADTYARTIGATGTAAYNQALWSKTGAFTTKLMKNASYSFASLFYTAWYNAGRPLISGGFFEDIDTTSNVNTAILSPEKIKLNSIYPNPAQSWAMILYSLEETQHIKLEIVDSLGKTLECLVDRNELIGNYAYEWSELPYEAGIYYVCLKTKDQIQTQKIIVSRN